MRDFCCVSVCVYVCSCSSCFSVHLYLLPTILTVSLRLDSDLWKPSVQKLWSKKPNVQLSWSSPRAVFVHFRDQGRTATTPEGQLVGRMLLQRLATGATSVKQASNRKLPTDLRGTCTHIRTHNLPPLYHFVHWHDDVFV